LHRNPLKLNFYRNSFMSNVLPSLGTKATDKIYGVIIEYVTI